MKAVRSNTNWKLNEFLNAYPHAKRDAKTDEKQSKMQNEKQNEQQNGKQKQKAVKTRRVLRQVRGGVIYVVDAPSGLDAEGNEKKKVYLDCYIVDKPDFHMSAGYEYPFIEEKMKENPVESEEIRNEDAAEWDAWRITVDADLILEKWVKWI